MCVIFNFLETFCGNNQVHVVRSDSNLSHSDKHRLSHIMSFLFLQNDFIEGFSMDMSSVFKQS